MPPLVSLPQAHALTSNTFRIPPLDGSLTVPEIFDWHLDHNPDHVLWYYSDADAVDHCGVITMKHGVYAIHRAARLFTARLTRMNLHPATHDPPVIAIFAATDTITYFHTWQGLIRAGYAVCHISHRNSSVALAHILQKSNADHLLISGEPGIQAVVRAALEGMADKEKQWDNFVSDMPIFADIFKNDEPDLMSKRDFNLNSRAYYIHSSGTTAFPKPISWTHKDYLIFAYSILLSEHDFCHQVLACHSIPMFHGLGILTTLFATCCGMTLSAFKPQFPAITMAPDSIFESAMQTGSTYIFSVPLFIEIWSRDPVKVAALSKINGVLYGGGPLNKAVGDFLTDHGVNIYITYGASENGMKAPILPVPPGKDWEYFQITRTYHPEFVPYGDGTYELIMVKCETHSPLVFNMTWNGAQAYATSDLLVPHPTKEGYWKVYGRTDDQIMLSTGEKTNPGPLESILCQDPRVQAAVMFGRGRFQNGVIVQPKVDYVFDPSDEAKLAEFRNSIWSTVERMNEYAPQHSRLFKEMILVASPTKPFQYTAKGSTRRQAILKDYESEIEALYQAVAETAQEGIDAPKDWDMSTVLEFVRRTVHGVMKAHVRDEDDLFEYGCDSLQATWIRNTLVRALRDSAVAPRAIPADLVYMSPTIASLARFITQNDHLINRANDEAQKAGDMLALLEKYCGDFPSRPGHAKLSPALDRHVILVTGTTGGLGASVLAELVSLPNVRKVYALNRPSSKGKAIEARQKVALAARGLDEGLVDSEKVVLIEGNLASPSLGLESALLDEIRSTLTTIIHIAYRVDFNLSLASFEPQLAIIRSLIDFAISSPRPTPPSIVFTSSVSVLRNLKLTSPAKEDALNDPKVAIGNGYSESKWISERILANAAVAVPSLRTLSVRVGQLSGTKSGAWNTAEWFPSLVASGPILRRLPDLDAEVAWIPLAAAARALVEMSLAEDMQASPVLHLAHPHPVPWTSLLLSISEELNVELVSYSDWLAALEENFKDKTKTEVQLMRENPALRLLAFFKSAGRTVGQNSGKDRGREAMGLPMMDMSRAKEVAPSLGKLQPLGTEDVRHWLEYWKDVGLLPRSPDATH